MSYETMELNRLRWLIVNARFPGFTKDVEVAFWYVVDELGIAPEQDLFVPAFQAKHNLPLDLSDRAALPNSSNGDSVTLWASEIYRHYTHLDDAIAMEDLAWFRGEVRADTAPPTPGPKAAEKRRIEELEAQIDKLKAMEDLEPKLAQTAYKIIYGVSVEKFKYNAKKNSSAATLISDCLERAGVPVTSETVRKTIRLAAQYLDLAPS